MSAEKHTTLKEALKNPDKLEKFIKERESENPGDESRLDKTISSFTSGSQKKKSTPETSAQDSSES